MYDGCYDFAAIAVVGGPAGKPVQAQDEPSGPCGVCRQVMQEFCGPDFEIHMQKAGGGVFTVKLPELLPFGFTKDSIEALFLALFTKILQRLDFHAKLCNNCLRP